MVQANEKQDRQLVAVWPSHFGDEFLQIVQAPKKPRIKSDVCLQHLSTDQNRG